MQTDLITKVYFNEHLPKAFRPYRLVNVVITLHTGPATIYRIYSYISPGAYKGKSALLGYF